MKEKPCSVCVILVEATTPEDAAIAGIATGGAFGLFCVDLCAAHKARLHSFAEEQREKYAAQVGAVALAGKAGAL